MTTPDVYSVTTKAISDKPLVKLLEELLLESAEAAAAPTCAERATDKIKTVHCQVDLTL